MTDKFFDQISIVNLNSSIINTTSSLSVSNLTCEAIESNTITGISTTFTGSLNKTITIAAQLQFGFPGITGSYQNGFIGAAQSSANPVIYHVHPVPGKVITWTGFVVGKDSDVTYTTGTVRVYKTPDGGSESEQTAQSFSGLSSGNSIYQAFSSTFTTETDDVLRVQLRRTNGSDGSESVCVLYGEISI